ncbi:MAG: hypothetical protein HKP61_19285 [Dactylosporangium sp.]|nr:hypothetical protein [Dactylosporangium sp.]NNJ63034.1 hypothetical protein [Dactylosporangium sp.]
MMRDGFVAQWGDVEYEASPDGDNIRLYRPDSAEGFEEVRPGRHRRIVPADECGGIGYVRTTCRWRQQPFIILAEHEGWLRVEYTGGLAFVAAELGLEEFDFGVYQGWAPRTEVIDIREQHA